MFGGGGDVAESTHVIREEKDKVANGICVVNWLICQVCGLIHARVKQLVM